MEQGYVVHKVYEVWHYKNTRLNGRRRGDSEPPEVGLFSSYMSGFAKLKTEASGLPPGVETDEEIARYIEEFKAREGITLEKDKIVRDEAQRQQAKLCMNNLCKYY